MDVIKKTFGVFGEQEVDSYTLRNDAGMQVTFMTYGGTIMEMLTPDKKGKLENVVLGFDTLEEYIQHVYYYGALVGRVAGRIGQASYVSNGKKVELCPNEDGNHLHGGKKGFDKVIWTVDDISVGGDEVSVRLSYLSRDGEEGYPGNVKVDVTYTLTNENAFAITYGAEPDRDTPINMTSHSYFNLSGDYKEEILSHRLHIPADHVLELSEEKIPTGAWIPTEGTAFDFHGDRAISDRMELGQEEGYDHAFCLNEGQQPMSLVHEDSGRVMTVETDQKAVILYTGNDLGGHELSGGVPVRKHLGLCLETQGYPDAVNHPHFPTVMVKKGEVYKASTTYSFHVLREQE
ncbi:aldose epimerase family protein [Rossellomorea sp. AcN35-11]|nr:galactose mutarotase [Rossellomorea aquimaris]WJV30917.1 aldose epimerase family protein [Rossellomorea sp. AcN35-11]